MMLQQSSCLFISTFCTHMSTALYQVLWFTAGILLQIEQLVLSILSFTVYGIVKGSHKWSEVKRITKEDWDISLG